MRFIKYICLLIHISLFSQNISFERENNGFDNNIVDMKFININSDMYQDIAILTSDSLITYFNNKSGQCNIKSNAYPIKGSTLFTSHLNDDLFNDLIISTETQVYSLLNTGNSTFSEPKLMIDNLDGNLEFGDLDNDGDIDIIVTKTQSKISTLKVYINNGTLFELKTENIISGMNQKFIHNTTLFDIDNDLDLDLIITRSDGPSTNNAIKQIFINNGLNIFTPQNTLPITSFYSIKDYFYDFNNDGLTDVFSGGQLFICHSKDLYNSPVTILDHSFKTTIKLVDLNQDGFMDIAVSKNDDNFWYKNTFTLYINDQSGNFSKINQNLFLQTNGKAFDFSDIDLDGDLDLFSSGLLSSKQSLSGLYIQTDSLVFKMNSAFGLKNSENLQNNLLQSIDLNNDQVKELIISGYTKDFKEQTHIYSTSKSTILKESPTLQGKNEGNIHFFDFDLDGHLDMLQSGGISNTLPSLSIQKGLGNYRFDKSSSVNFGTTRTFTQPTDIDQDGDIDIIGYDMSPESSLIIYENLGDFKFTTHLIKNLDNVDNIKILDLNNDQKNEIIISDSKSNFIGFLKYEGYGKVKVNTSPFPIDLQVEYIYHLDIDLDGDIDLIAQGKGLFPEINVLINEGNNVFNYHPEAFNLPQENGIMDFNDLDGDGDEDLVFMSKEKDIDNLVVFTNNTQTFKNNHSASIQGSYQNAKLITEDINQDDRPDIIITHQNNEVTIFKNTTHFPEVEYSIIEACETYIDPKTSTEYHKSIIINDTISKTIQGVYKINRTHVLVSTINTSIELLPSKKTIQSKDYFATKYQWLNVNLNNSPIDGEINDSFTPVFDGKYAVEITTKNCVDTSTVFDFKKASESNHLFSVYPNPSSSSVTIESLSNKNTNYSIYNINGVIMSKQLIKSTSKTTVELSGWAAGLYFIELTTDNKTQIIKLIKQN